MSKRILLYLTLLLVGGGCALGDLRDPGDPVTMTPDSLAGTWHHGTDRYVTFDKDGTFDAISLPPDDGGWGPGPAGTGTWTIQDRDGAFGGLATGPSTAPDTVVHLHFTTYDGSATPRREGLDLDAVRPGDGQVWLVRFGSSPDANIGYLKCATACSPPSPSPTASSAGSPPAAASPGRS